MRFDGNKAWQEAVAAVSANREVLFPVAGVFFLIPAVAQAFFFSDIQAAALANLANPEAAEAMMAGQMGTFVLFASLAALVQLIGYLTLLALLTDRNRPTVGEAILIGLKSLPTLIGAAILFAIGYFVLAVIYGLTVGLIGAAIGSAALSAALMLLLVAAVIYFMIKLSLTLPVVIIERVLNPVTALLRSWRLTSGNSFRLALFYFLLFVAYLAIALVVSLLIMGLLTLTGEAGALTIIIAGVLSGVLAAVAGVLFAAILAAIHRQLAGPSVEAEARTFE